MSSYNTIAVPYDFSEHSEAALAAAVDLASKLDAELHLLNVLYLPVEAYSLGASGTAPGVDAGAFLEETKKQLAVVADGIDLPKPVVWHVTQGANLALSICDELKRIGADMAVMGTHGRTGLAHVFLGSVTERTLRTAPCPVLTVRA